MYLCRIAWHNLVPLARNPTSSRAIRNVYRNASIRQMSSGGPPGSSSENTILTLMVGAVIAGASVYTYKVLYKDKARYNERVAEIMERPKNEWRASQPKKEDESDEVQPPEVVETSEESSGPTTEEVKDPESVEEPEIPAAVVEPKENPLKGEATLEEEEKEALPLPTSPKDAMSSVRFSTGSAIRNKMSEADEVQSPEVVEAAKENTETVSEEDKVPEAETTEEPARPSALVEPKDILLEGETETLVAAPEEAD